MVVNSKNSGTICQAEQSFLFAFDLELDNMVCRVAINCFSLDDQESGLVENNGLMSAIELNIGTLRSVQHCRVIICNIKQCDCVSSLPVHNSSKVVILPPDAWAFYIAVYFFKDGLDRPVCRLLDGILAQWFVECQLHVALAIFSLSDKTETWLESRSHYLECAKRM